MKITFSKTKPTKIDSWFFVKSEFGRVSVVQLRDDHNDGYLQLVGPLLCAPLKTLKGYEYSTEGFEFVDGTELQIDDLVGKVIKFTTKVNELDVGFEGGMIAKIISTKISQKNNDIEINFDFAEYEEHNKTLMPSDWYNTDGVACLRWCDTIFYPKNKKDNVFFDLTSWKDYFVLYEG